MDSRRPFDRRFSPDDVPWDRILAWTPAILVGMLVVFLASNSVYKVEPHERAVVMRFGKYYPPNVGPGLHFCIPLVDRVEKVSIEERSLRLPFGRGPGRPPSALEEESLMLTGDLNAASVEWTIQWKVTDPAHFLFRFYDKRDPDYVQRIVTLVASTVMNRLVGDYSIDEILTDKRLEIAEKARDETQTILDKYECGVAIQELQMQQVTPPKTVGASFSDVNASIQRREKLTNEANTERDKLLPAARADRHKLTQEALGYAKRRQAEAAGEIAALRAKYKAYSEAPGPTRQRLYIEAMEEALGAVQSKVIVDAELQGRVLPLLQLDQGAKP